MLDIGAESKCVLLIVDYYSRAAETNVIQTKKTEEVVNVVEECFEDNKAKPRKLYVTMVRSLQVNNLGNNDCLDFVRGTQFALDAVSKCI